MLASKLGQIHMLSKTYKPGDARGRSGTGSSFSAPDVSVQRERRKPEEFESIKLRVEAGVARMTLNRPEHNLLNEAMLREMADGIAFAGEQEEVKMIVIDSACRVFCGGIDIGEYTSQRVFQMLDIVLMVQNL